ncbi:12302_t:CDS:2, partial [Ambispora gerdemannii]
MAEPYDPHFGSADENPTPNYPTAYDEYEEAFSSSSMGKSVPNCKPIPIVVETPHQKKIRELEEELKQMVEEATDRVESMVKAETNKATEIIEQLRSENYNLKSQASQLIIKDERIAELERQ